LSLEAGQHKPILDSVSYWLEQAVIGLGLCPFAQSVWLKQRIRFAISDSKQGEQLLLDLYDECRYLEAKESAETTLLISPYCLRDFETFNRFLGIADDLLESYDWRGVFQIASFHPDYQFADTSKADRENWTNRSPYPILHILRESSLDRAVAEYPSVEKVPDTNIQRLRQLDKDEFNRIFFPVAKGSK